MKRLTLTALAATAMILASGCMSDKQMGDLEKMHANLIAQQRTYGAVQAKFAPTGGSVTFTGVTELTLEAPLTPITVMPQTPDGIREVADGLVRVGTVAAAAYVGHELVKSVGSTSVSTVNNAAPAATP
jgi:hypothetical protein